MRSRPRTGAATLTCWRSSPGPRRSDAFARSWPGGRRCAPRAPSRDRKIVLATRLAETALTVEGVGSVIDTGLHKVVRLDPAVGVDRLEVERISRDSADQRAGRAGRTRAGRAIRLWDARDILRDHREPEIARVDLSAPLLE